MAISKLLSLPVELIAKILNHASPQDFICCQKTCRFIHSLVQQDTQMQYRIELFKACMVEGSRGNLTSEECLRILRRREQAWRELRWENGPEIAFGALNSNGVHFQLDVRGLYAFGEVRSGIKNYGVAHTALPSLEDKSEEARSDVHFKEPQSSNFLIEDTYADISQDLLVLVELTLNSLNSTYRLHLYTLSTDLSHPSASQPILWRNVETNGFRNCIAYVDVRITGDYIGILSIWSTTESPRQQFDLWNWRTGIRREVLDPTQGRWTSFFFLRDDTILLNAASNDDDKDSVDSVADAATPEALRVYRIPSDDNCPVQHTATFCLPALQPSAALCNVFVYNQQALSLEYSTRRRLYCNDPNTGIVVLRLLFSLEIDRRNTRKRYTLVIDKSVLLSASPTYPTTTSETSITYIPWDDWGVNSTRILPHRLHQRTQPAVYGARYATLSLPINGLHSLTVYDFNTRQRTNRPDNHANTFITIEETVVFLKLFVHPVRTSLPYRVASSAPVLHWPRCATIVMDEEYIIGVVKTKDNDHFQAEANILIF